VSTVGLLQEHRLLDVDDKFEEIVNHGVLCLQLFREYAIFPIAGGTEVKFSQAFHY